jgi:hypothetical protein
LLTSCDNAANGGIETNGQIIITGTTSIIGKWVVVESNFKVDGTYWVEGYASFNRHSGEMKGVKVIGNSVTLKIYRHDMFNNVSGYNGSHTVTNFLLRVMDQESSSGTMVTKTGTVTFSDGKVTVDYGIFY